MRELIYSDGRAKRLRQFFFTAEDVAAGELDNLRHAAEIHNIHEYYHGKYYIAKVLDLSEHGDDFIHLPGYKPLYMGNCQKGLTFSDILLALETDTY